MRKHGGEKGVPFRVQIDTFKENENGEYTEHLHSASCQIKVFKVLFLGTVLALGTSSLVFPLAPSQKVNLSLFKNYESSG